MNTNRLAGMADKSGGWITAKDDATYILRAVNALDGDPEVTVIRVYAGVTSLVVRPTPVASTGYYEATRHPHGWHFTANEIPGSRGGSLITINGDRPTADQLRLIGW